MRNTFADVLYEIGKDDERICALVADISPAGSMVNFREEFPERFINCGVAEQSMIGIAAGMALEGMRPFCYTIATFSLYRPFEMIRVDLAYQNLPVTVIGMGAGVVYSTLGSTHHSMEDIAIASAIPNMSVLAPCDPEEMRSATEWCATQSQGPVYMRLGKAGEPVLTKDALDPFRFGKVRHMSKGEDVAVLSYGIIMDMVKDVAQALRDQGRSVSLVSTPTIKPLDVEGITHILQNHKDVIIVEEHVPQGGLASQVKQIAWDCGATCKLHLHTLKDEFIHCYGSYAEILDAHDISMKKILAPFK